MATDTPVTLVTGAARGIGLGIARRLLADGGRVAMADIDAATLATAVAALDADHRVLALEMDVREEVPVAVGMQQTLAHFGRLDGLVNNAGIADPHTGPLEALSLAAWRRMLDSHLTGAFLVTRAALPHLRRQRGAIVNIASTRALQSEPDCEAYAASKGGLLAMTHALAVSAGPEVRVNAISPGWIDVRGDGAAPLRDIDHRQHPVGHVGLPHDIAALAAWLLSPAAGFVSGQNFVVDGGMTRRMHYAD